MKVILNLHSYQNILHTCRKCKRVQGSQTFLKRSQHSNIMKLLLKTYIRNFREFEKLIAKVSFGSKSNRCPLVTTNESWFWLSYYHVTVRPKFGFLPKKVLPKGQLISKANFDVFIWTKNQTKILLYFCPSSLKWVKSKKEHKLLY